MLLNITFEETLKKNQNKPKRNTAETKDTLVDFVEDDLADALADDKYIMTNQSQTKMIFENTFTDNEDILTNHYDFVCRYAPNKS